ncbi:MAG: hypothetical protein HC879_19805 [Leptolyngbyaceae cyanobacterium SL_5_9]|nr:hypothetical protein [Leptolyngbyaceae cyanobacterium SL_5_9]NJO73467.1 hypothetical protein [Leptolyngbyaceae cyanobacterium RM1_406_9]
MRYSLSSRFQGVLLGAALGEILGTHCQLVQVKQPQVKPPLRWADLSRWGFSDLNPEDSAVPAGWGRVAVRLAKGLIQGGSDKSWMKEVLDVLGIPVQPSNPEQTLFEQKAASTQSFLQTQSSPINAGVAIATLPIALFFHADPDQLEQELQQADKLHHRLELSNAVLAIGYAISLALREQLDPAQLIAEIMEELELRRDRSTSAPSPSLAQFPFVEQLQFVQTLSQVSLSSAIAQLRHYSRKPEVASDVLEIAIAFHCFLSTPEDFRLSAVRAAQLHKNPQTTCLTAALSGAYNGASSIPLSWRSALKRNDSAHSPLNHLWGVASETELQHLSDQLLAAWSGAFDLDHLLNYPGQTFAIAAPKVIRPD